MKAEESATGTTGPRHAPCITMPARPDMRPPDCCVWCVLGGGTAVRGGGNGAGVSTESRQTEAGTRRDNSRPRRRQRVRQAWGGEDRTRPRRRRRRRARGRPRATTVAYVDGRRRVSRKGTRRAGLTQRPASRGAVAPRAIVCERVGRRVDFFKKLPPWRAVTSGGDAVASIERCHGSQSVAGREARLRRACSQHGQLHGIDAERRFHKERLVGDQMCDYEAMFSLRVAHVRLACPRMKQAVHAGRRHDQVSCRQLVRLQRPLALPCNRELGHAQRVLDLGGTHA